MFNDDESYDFDLNNSMQKSKSPSSLQKSLKNNNQNYGANDNFDTGGQSNYINYDQQDDFQQDYNLDT